MGKTTDKINLIACNIYRTIQSFFWKRNSSVVLFGSWFGEKFADNTRFLFQYLSEHKIRYGLTHVVWVSRLQSVVDTVRKLGYEAYLIDSEESIYYHKLALFHIVCNATSDIQAEYSNGAVKINLWHGPLGFKNVGCSSLDYLKLKNRHKFLFSIRDLLHDTTLYRYIGEGLGGWGNCYYLSNTPTTTKQFMDYFRMPSEYYIEAGSPRTSYQPKLTPEEEKIVAYIKTFKKAIFYLPTFRMGESSFDFIEAGHGLQKYLRENNYLWVEKVHSASIQKPADDVGENILNLPHDFDVNILIPHVDMMVSDYSSAIGDAMYFYKPVAFYVPDLNEYRTGERGFVDNFEELMCGPKCQTVDELRDAIDVLLKNDFKPDSHYIDIRYRYYGSDRTMDEIWRGILEGVKDN